MEENPQIPFKYVVCPQIIINKLFSFSVAFVWQLLDGEDWSTKETVSVLNILFLFAGWFGIT